MYFYLPTACITTLHFLMKKLAKKKVLKASKELGIHEFIKSLPGGYDYNVQREE